MAKSSMLAGLKWNFLYMIHFNIIPPTALMYYYNSQVDYSSRHYDLQRTYIFDLSLRAVPQTHLIFLHFIILTTFAICITFLIMQLSSAACCFSVSLVQFSP